MYKFCDFLTKEKLSIFTTPDSLEVKLSNLVQSEIDNFALFNDLRDGLNSLSYRSLHMSSIKNIVVIGCGGTGSWLIPKLVKTMNDLKRKDLLCPEPKLILVDGDTVEPKNLIRQNFIETDIGSNKAEAMALRYGPHLTKGIEVIYFDKYITNKKNLYSGVLSDKFMNISVLVGLIGQKYKGFETIIFNLVDNQNARRVLHGSVGKYLTADLRNEDNRIVIADVGNEDTYGQLYSTFYTSINYKILTKDTFFDFSPETVETDEEVSVYSCAEADVDQSKEDQFLIANDTAATVAHNWLASYMSGQYLIPQLVRFTCAPNPYVKVEKYMMADYINSYLLDLINFFSDSSRVNNGQKAKFLEILNSFNGEIDLKEFNVNHLTNGAGTNFLNHMFRNPEFLASIKQLIVNS